jgi:hypothetical protein
MLKILNACDQHDFSWVQQRDCTELALAGSEL